MGPKGSGFAVLLLGIFFALFIYRGALLGM